MNGMNGGPQMGRYGVISAHWGNINDVLDLLSDSGDVIIAVTQHGEDYTIFYEEGIVIDLEAANESVD
jgi:hypothetical protein